MRLFSPGWASCWGIGSPCNAGSQLQLQTRLFHLHEVVYAQLSNLSYHCVWFHESAKHVCSIQRNLYTFGVRRDSCDYVTIHRCSVACWTNLVSDENRVYSLYSPRQLSLYFAMKFIHLLLLTSIMFRSFNSAASLYSSSKSSQWESGVSLLKFSSSIKGWFIEFLPHTFLC